MARCRSSRDRAGTIGGWRLPFALSLAAASLLPSAARAATVQFWFPTWNAAVQAWLQETAIPSFEAEHPGVNIEVVLGSWSDYENKLLVAFAAGTFPDVYLIPAEGPRRHARQGWATPLDPYLSRWGETADYLPVALAAARVDGRQYGLPWSIQGASLILRKSVALEAGLDDVVPATWDAFRVAAQRMTQIEGGTVSRVGYQMPWDQPFMNWVHAAGGELFSSDFRRAVIDSPPAEAALSYLVGLRQLVQPSGMPVARLDFAAGTVGMREAEPTYLGTLRLSSPDVIDDIAVGVTPRGERHAVRVYVPNLAIGSQSRQKDLAWAWLAYLQRPDNLLTYNALFGRLSPRRSHLQATYLDELPPLRDFLNVYAMHGIPHVWPAASSFAYMRQPLREQLAAALAGDVSPRQALAEVARAWQVELDKSEQP
ncbi:MAG TPA: sugar ABC transporter substrate-binding protein [Limnochordia bacterium]